MTSLQSDFLSLSLHLTTTGGKREDIGRLRVRASGTTTGRTRTTARRRIRRTATTTTPIEDDGDEKFSAEQQR